MERVTVSEPEIIISSKFERILEADTEGVVTLDIEGRYTYANDAAEFILGVDRSRIVQRVLNQTEWTLTTLKGKPLPEEETPFKKVLQTSQAVYDLKCMVKRQDGKLIVISTNAAPLYDETGDLDGVVGTSPTSRQRMNSRSVTMSFDLAPLFWISSSVPNDLEKALRSQKFL
ncbi:MAG: hypothetical protein C0616_03635 [Desulfuromonas sp.]|nr:MAG: hypothetical protein C0616_03635 [Desulfuromonas sp.]